MKGSLEELAGGVAVITGAGSGIGAGLARKAAGAGMHVVLADILQDRIEAVANEIEGQGGRALPIVTDVSDPAALDRLAQRTHDELGAVRLLVNNAGIEMLGNVWDISAATWEKAMSINVMGVIHGVRAFVPHMLNAGAPAFIANLSSVGGLGIMPIQTPYIVSKHAVLAFTECLALELELAEAPISVSAVLPGPVTTRIFQDAPTGEKQGEVAPHRAFMEAMLRDHGLDPDTAGQRILEGIVARQFWVSCHPEMMAAAAKERADRLSGLEPPHMTEAMRAIVAG